MATIKDVASKAGVAVSTVSRVINSSGYVGEETKKRVLNAMKELRFRPSHIARGLVSGKTYTIGLIIPDIANPFFPEIARGVEDEAIKNNFNVILCNSDWKIDREKMYLSLLLEKWCDGVIIVGSRSEEIDLLRTLGDLPFVSMDRDISSAGHSVWVDNVLGGYTATKHLYSMGYRHVIHISGPLNAPSAVARRKGYELAVKEFALQSPVVVESDYRKSGGFTAVMSILDDSSKERFDAVFAGNDLMAIGVLHAANDRGICIGEELGVIGYDGIPESEDTFPSLTTMFQPGYEMGRRACELLLSEIATPSSRLIKEVFKAELKIRKSTKRS
ncbi:LacI family transcriptional regulator [Fodinisporobacter ferrooxydans]|uniref:LacI family transcriptional regulator n=1 Tax=Fodinisporobacter ferrooxydans TaxID=2901836 RepID=A0ABY4CDN4_9BACL|nr:LacI family transcriptional regulator [Alicyclobacillaceae bacterium MYW30-H2]